MCVDVGVSAMQFPSHTALIVISLLILPHFVKLSDPYIKDISKEFQKYNFTEVSHGFMARIYESQLKSINKTLKLTIKLPPKSDRIILIKDSTELKRNHQSADCRVKFGFFGDDIPDSDDVTLKGYYFMCDFKWSINHPLKFIILNVTHEDQFMMIYYHRNKCSSIFSEITVYGIAAYPCDTAGKTFKVDITDKDNINRTFCIDSYADKTVKNKLTAIGAKIGELKGSGYILIIIGILIGILIVCLIIIFSFYKKLFPQIRNRKRKSIENSSTQNTQKSNGYAIHYNKVSSDCSDSADIIALKSDNPDANISDVEKVEVHPYNETVVDEPDEEIVELDPDIEAEIGSIHLPSFGYTESNIKQIFNNPERTMRWLEALWKAKRIDQVKIIFNIMNASSETKEQMKLVVDDFLRFQLLGLMHKMLSWLHKTGRIFKKDYEGLSKSIYLFILWCSGVSENFCGSLVLNSKILNILKNNLKNTEELGNSFTQEKIMEYSLIIITNILQMKNETEYFRDVQQSLQNLSQLKNRKTLSTFAKLAYPFLFNDEEILTKTFDVAFVDGILKLLLAKESNKTVRNSDSIQLIDGITTSCAELLRFISKICINPAVLQEIVSNYGCERLFFAFIESDDTCVIRELFRCYRRMSLDINVRKSLKENAAFLEKLDQLSVRMSGEVKQEAETLKMTILSEDSAKDPSNVVC